MNDFWVIGDVAGEYDVLMKLLAKLPKDAKLVFVGDLNDRGPKTKEVIEFVRSGGHVALMGNHEHMFIDYIESRHYPKIGHKFYDSDCFMYNGGIPTLKSYLGKNWQGWRPSKASAKVLEDIQWLKERPLKFEAKGVIVTHAPIKYGDIARFNETSVINAIWNRDWICPTEDGTFQFFGHNGHYKEFGKGLKPYAICVDDSRNRNLTAVHWPSLEKIQEPF